VGQYRPESRDPFSLSGVQIFDGGAGGGVSESAGVVVGTPLNKKLLKMALPES